MGLLDRGQAALLRRQQQAAGRSVTYFRGTEAITITAWIGSADAVNQREEPGGLVALTERDYLFAAADLVIAGQLTTPLKGDRISEVIAGQELSFGLQPRDAEPGWRYSDPMRTTIRVHLIRVKTP